MNFIGQEQYIEIDNRVYRLPRLSRRIMRTWARWAKQTFPNPVHQIVEVIAQNLPIEIKHEIIETAMDQIDLLNDPLSTIIQNLLLTWTGQREILAIMLQESERLLLADARLLLDKATNIDWDQIIRIASGRIWTESEMEQHYYEESGLLEPKEYQWQKIDWLEIDRKLLEFLSPQELDDLTIPELFNLYHERQMADSSKRNVQKSWLQMNPEQKLELAKRLWEG